MSDSNSKSGGVGILGLMFLIFMTLKLTGFIDWSWWWVTSPLWMPVFLIITIGIILIIIKKQ